MEPILFDPIAEHMAGQDVGLLNARGIAGGDGEEVIGEGGKLATACTGKGHRDKALGAGCLQRGDYVGAVTGSRDAHQQVAGETQRLDLAGKYGLEAAVVGDSGEDGGIGSQSHRRQPAALAAKAADDFRGQVLGVGGAATIAAPEDFAPGAQGGGHGQSNGFQKLLLLFDLAHHMKVLRDGFGKDLRGIGTAGQFLLPFHTSRFSAGVHDGGRTNDCCYHSGVKDSASTFPSRNLRTIFLDRDGVLNEKMPEGRYVTRWSEFHLLPGVAEAIGRLNRAGLRVVVVSNQRGVSLGLYTTADVRAIHTELQNLLASHSAHVDGFYFCPHGKGECICRKPLPGMFEQARAEFPEIAAETSAMIGDSRSDIEFGRRLGMLTVFIEGDPERQKAGNAEAAELADLRFGSLPDAVDGLLIRG